MLNLFNIVALAIFAHSPTQELEIPFKSNNSTSSKVFEIYDDRFANDTKITDDHPPHFISKLDGETPASNVAYCAFMAYYDTVYPAILIYKTNNGGLNWEFLSGIYNTSGIRIWLCAIVVSQNRICISYVRDSDLKINTYSIPKTGGSGSFYEFPQNHAYMPWADLSKKGSDDIIDIAFNYNYSTTDACIIYYRSANGGVNWSNEYSFALGENHMPPAIYRLPQTNTIYLAYYSWTLSALKFSVSTDGGSNFISQIIPNTEDVSNAVDICASSSYITIMSANSTNVLFIWSSNGGVTWNQTITPIPAPSGWVENYDVCFGGGKFRASANAGVIKYKSATLPSDFGYAWQTISDGNAAPGQPSVCYLSNGSLCCWDDYREGYYSKIYCDAEGWIPSVEDKNFANKTSSVNTLNQNYPNPIVSRTVIKYSIANPCKVELKLFDLTGRQIATLVNENQKPGYYQVNWDIRNFSEKELPDGVYFYRLTAGDYTNTKRMVIVR